MVSKIVSNCQEEPIRYVNLAIPIEKQVEGDLDEDINTSNTVGTSATCSVFCSLPLNKEVRDILENLDTAPIKATLLQQQPSSSLLNTKKPRKFLCLYCERTFATGSLRSKHEERCHSAKQARRSSSRFQQSPLKPTVCFLCPQNNDPPSLCPNDLFKHLLDAHSDAYFGCYECKERFSSSTHLQSHQEELHSSQEDLNNGISVSNDLSPSSPPNGTIEDVKLNIEKEADIEDDDPDEPNRVQLRKRSSRRRKIAFRSAKLGVKRNTRLQAKQNLQTLKKRNVKTLAMDSSATTTPEKSGSSGSSVNSVSLSENPYPAFDAYYRVKKITDHSIDNLRISSLTFDDVFDKAFYNRIKCNIRENLMNHLDGKLFKNKESDARISNFEKGHNRLQSINQPQQQQNQHQVSASATTENYGCELSLNAATPASCLSTTHQLQTGEDILESQIEYGSKASNGKKKSQSSGQEEVRFKYLTRRKYQASILESKENRDLSRLDMWTQIVVKNRQQRIADDNKSDKEKSDYKNGEEYKAKKQNEELNRVLDKRGPFEDLKEEANKQAALEGNHLQEAYVHVTSIMEDILSKVFDGTTMDEVESKPPTIPVPVVPIVQQVADLPAYLNLQRGCPSQPTYIDKSDKISLICSSQEIEGYNDHDPLQSEPMKLVELTGEWARSRMYICAVCGLKVSNMKLLMEHKSIVHSNVWCQHYEFVGNQGELYRHLSIPALGKMGEIETQPTRVMWRRSEARRCSKCTKQCNSLGELHRHILECGEDWAWMMVRKKCKYRPFGAKTRKKRRGLFKRIVPSERLPGEKRSYKKKYHHDGPRQKPSDAETIQRMLANLPAKRATRKIMSLKDGFPSHRKARTTPASNKTNDNATVNSEDAAPVRKSKCNPVLRSSIRNVSKVIASKILDTNSSLVLRRRLRRNMRNAIPLAEKTEEETASEEVTEEDGAKKQEKISLQDRVKLIRKKVARKVQAKKVQEATTAASVKAQEKRVTRNSPTKADTEITASDKKSFIKKALKTGTKLIQTLSQRSDKPTDESESLSDALLDNNSIDIVIELIQTPVLPAAIPVIPEVTSATEPEKLPRRSTKKRRSNVGTAKTVAKKICLRKPEVPTNETKSLDVQKEVISAENDDFLGTLDQIPTVLFENEVYVMIQKTPSLEVLAGEVLKSDASASVAISEVVVDIAVCPKELPTNEVVDLSVQHTPDNVVPCSVTKVNNTPLSKRCKRNKGLNDCIAMLTSKLLHVTDEENNQTADTSTNNVSLQSTDVINKVVTNICEPIKLKEVCTKQDTSVCELKRHPLNASPQVNSDIINPNILNIPPVLNSKSNEVHRISLPSTIVPIIKIPNYPLKLFGVDGERNIFRSSDLRHMNLNIPHDLNIYPVDPINKACELVAQDLTMPAIRVPSCTFPDTTTSSKPTEPIKVVLDVRTENFREPAESANPEKPENKPLSELLNMSTYEMKTIIPSTETIISTAEPEILAGNPLPEEVIQKSQMLPIEAAKCDIEENKGVVNKSSMLNDLKEISENLISLKKVRRPVKPRGSKPSVPRSRSKRKENTVDDAVFNKPAVIESKVEETEIVVLQTSITQQKYLSAQDANVEVLPLQNIGPLDFEDMLPQSNIIKKPKPVSLALQEQPIVKGVDFSIKSLLNAPSDSDDELPLSKLKKTPNIPTPTSDLLNYDVFQAAHKNVEIPPEETKIVDVPFCVNSEEATNGESVKVIEKQVKKPARRKPTKKQKKTVELPIALTTNNSELSTEPSEPEPILPSPVNSTELVVPPNLPDPAISSVGDLLVTLPKPTNRKKGKRRRAATVIPVANVVLPQIMESAEDHPTIKPGLDVQAIEAEKNNDIPSIDVLPDASVTVEATNELPEKPPKVTTKRGRARRKKEVVEDEIPLSILMKSKENVDELSSAIGLEDADVSKSEVEEPSTINLEKAEVAESINNVLEVQDKIETTDNALVSHVPSEETNIKETIKKPVNRRKRGRKTKSKQTKRTISKPSTFNFAENDNAVSPGNMESTLNNEINEVQNGNLVDKKMITNLADISKLFNNIKEDNHKMEVENDEVDGPPTIFTDSSIRTCSIIEATIESAFRLNSDSVDLTPAVDSLPVEPIETFLHYPGTVLNGAIVDDKEPAILEVFGKNRKSSKRPDRKKRRKKIKLRRMPKLKAMKAYIDSVSEDTTSKGLDTPDEQSTSDINLECLLRTNTSSPVAEDSIINTVLTEGFSIDDNKPSSPLMPISDDLPDMCRSDLSTPIEEFATDCNNSFDGLIRSHEAFDVSRDLDGLDITPRKLSVLDPAERFDSLTSKDLDIEEISKNLDQLEANIEPVEEPKTDQPAQGTKKKVKKRGKGRKATRKSNAQALKKTSKNLIPDEVYETIPSVMETSDLNQQTEIVDSNKIVEVLIDAAEENFEPKVVSKSISESISESATARKFDSSIYDFDPTSEDLLLDETSLCKSPSKQKIKHTINKELLAEATVTEPSFSPRRSRSRKSESNVTKVESEVDLKTDTLTAELPKNDDILAIHSPNVLKEIHDENEVNFSPRRSRSRKSETVLVETEVPSNIIEAHEKEEETVVKETEPSTIISNIEGGGLKPKPRLKAKPGRIKGKARAYKKVVLPDPNIEEKEFLCDICKKAFARIENLMKHNRTLTHVAKLSEIEAREAQIKADKEKSLKSLDPDPTEDVESVNMDEEDMEDLNKFSNDVSINCNSEIDVFPTAPYALPPKLADIISDVLSKPVDLNSFDSLPQPNSQTKRYKSLGERKSFESEAVAYSNNQFSSHLNEEPMPSNIQTADSILKTQISILENIIENKSNFYDMNEDSCKSTDSKQSNGRCPSDMSLVSDIKQDDSNIISFSQHSNMNIIEPRLTGSFLKPSSHYEEISEDSTVVRKHFEDQKARKVLNRDEELFLECCSLLKSSSEVSNFSKQSARKAIPSRPVDEHDWLKTNQFYESNSNFHESNPHSNTTDFYSDASRANSPLGNSFIGDISNSDTLRNDWQSESSKFKKADSFEDISLGSMNDNTNDNILTKEDSILNKDDVSNMSNATFSDDFNLDSGSLKNEASTDPKIEEFAMSMKDALTSSNKNKLPKKKSSSETSQTSITDYAIPIVKENVDDINILDRKVITKGARKVFEGLKVSIPTNELNMKEVLSYSPAIISLNSVDSPVSKKKLSKIGNKLGLKVTKKKNKPKKKEDLNQTIIHNSDKIHDVYDFEETQDNTDLFSSNLTKFRAQGSERNESNLNIENSDNDEPKSKPDTPNIDDLPSLSNFSESESTHSTKQKKKVVSNDPISNNNNKKKCMIMGRIFKNAFKSRIDLEISDIPCVDNNSLVENYVMNCTNPAEIESRFDKLDKDDKKKMSQEEMDALFDKLLHESDNIKFSKDCPASDNNKMKPPPLKKSSPKTDKPKNGIKRRQRQNSNTSDDEFCLTKTQRKKPTKKKVQDNSINLEQELKECMGVAGRKSQRKCTSGKQNVLVEYWSSDDSNFEALINPDFVRRKRDKDKRELPKQVAAEIVSPPQIDPAVLAEIHKDILNATKQKSKKNGVKRKQPKTDANGEASKVNRRKRSTGDTLYYWSSSSDDESRDLIEVKPIREEIDDDDEDRPMQHGWIVGDSPKKLVTMLAHAKGKKIDTGVYVKEQPKKRTSL